MVKAVVFDMDGVIFDSERVWQRVFRVVSERFGYNLGEYVRHNLCGMGEANILAYFRENHPEVAAVAFRKAALLEYRAEILRGENRLKPGFLALCQWLKGKKIPIGLATGSTLEQVELCFQKVGLEYKAIFDAVVCSGTGVKEKPDPEIYLEACKRLGTAPEDSVVLEDSINGLKAAISANCKAVFVRDLIVPSAEILDKCYAKCDSLAEVLALLKSESKHSF